MQQVLAGGASNSPHHAHNASGGGSGGGGGESGGWQQGGDSGRQLVAPRPMALTSSGAAREAEAYYARVVAAAWDLREALLRGAARALLGRLLDPDRGIVAVVAGVPGYGSYDPPTKPHQWAEGVGNALRNLGAALGRSERQLPAQVQEQVRGMHEAITG
jgi:hypothetical protein